MVSFSGDDVLACLKLMKRETCFFFQESHKSTTPAMCVVGKSQKHELVVSLVAEPLCGYVSPWSQNSITFHIQYKISFVFEKNIDIFY